MSVCKVLLFARPLPNPAAPWSPIWLFPRLRERGGAIDEVLVANPFHSHISHTRHHPHSTNHTPPSCPTSPHTRASPPIPMRRSLDPVRSWEKGRPTVHTGGAQTMCWCGGRMHEWSGVGMHVCVCVCLCVYECVWVCGVFGEGPGSEPRGELT